jgi:ATP/maltotriose-dependent transcriptional regulator MalT
MPSRLADYLNAARRAHFVGRAHEKNFFRAALAAAPPPFFVLYMYGPGGVGKSTLLREFGRMAEETGWQALYFDARNTEPLPEPFLHTLARYLDAPSEKNLPEFLDTLPRRLLLMVDTYETLTPLDDWMRETFLPQLPENVLVILCGRNPLAPAWRADVGWQAFLEILPLRNLAPDETRDYLSRRNIPENQQQTVLNFTHGHPLALSLIAETFAQRAGGDFRPLLQPEKTHDLIQTLVKNFLQKVPGPAHRAALESCALVRVTTEPVLCEMLGTPDVHDLFNWMHDLSFIEPRPGGLFPHDLAREALLADLRWRNPDWYVELHHRARHYYTHRISVTTGLEQQRALFDLVFLQTANPSTISARWPVLPITSLSRMFAVSRSPKPSRSKSPP